MVLIYCCLNVIIDKLYPLWAWAKYLRRVKVLELSIQMLLYHPRKRDFDIACITNL